MSRTGIPICEKALKAACQEVDSRSRLLEEKLRSTELYKHQRRKFGTECNLRSRSQLGWVLYEYMKLPGGRKDKTGKWACDKNDLANVDLPEIPDYAELMKLDKLSGTYLQGMKREIVNGRIHAMFGLSTAVSYRGNASNPSVQNFPLRDKNQGRIIRSCVVPPEGYAIVETDLSSGEVRSAICYHQDFQMLIDLENGHDMHKAVGSQAYFIPQTQLPKDARQAAKGFVFSQQYGSTYKLGAANLWKEASKLKAHTGVPMLEWLASNGIKSLGDPKAKVLDPSTYMHHIRNVETTYWARYPKYRDWRTRFYNSYLHKGYFEGLSGFVWSGVYGFTEVINYPPQALSFHWLLHAAIEATAEISKRKMESRLICQIHDSILGLVPLSELDDYVPMVLDCMTTRTLKRFPFVNVPLLAEAEWSAESWHKKAAYEPKV